MDCSLLQSLECCTDGGQTASVGVCCCDGTFAAFTQGNRVSVCYINNTTLPLLELSSEPMQQQSVGALALCSGKLGTQQLLHEQKQTLLAAATPDGLLIWVLEEAYMAAAARQKPLPALQLADNGGTAVSEALALHSDGLAAVARNNVVDVWDLQHQRLVYRLEAHAASVTALTFHAENERQLISAAEDRTFNIWDLEEGQLLYQSSVFAAAVPACIAVDGQRLAVGCADGSVHQYDMSLLPTCRQMQALDVSNSLQQVSSAAVSQAQSVLTANKHASLPQRVTAASAFVDTVRQQMVQLTCTSATAVNQPMDSLVQQDCSLAAATDGSGCIIGMQFIQRQCASKTSSSGEVGCSLRDQKLLDDIMRPAPWLLVCTRRGLLLIDVGSGAVEQSYVFGTEAEDVWRVLAASDNNSGPRAATCSKAAGNQRSPLQQPSEQQLQQRQKLASSFRALPEVHQPATACCFAWHHHQHSGRLQLICCITSGLASKISLLQLSPARRQSGWGTANSTHAATAGDVQQQLSVYQTEALPPGSVLLSRSAEPSRLATTAATSCTSTHGRGSGTVLTGRSSGNGRNPLSEQHNQSRSDSGRARWSQPQGDMASNAAADRGAKAVGRVQDVVKPRSPSAGQANRRSSSKSQQLAEKPVTFHKKIKSSGYGFVQPKIKLGQAKPAPVKVGIHSSKGPQVLNKLSEHRQYPLDAGVPTVLQSDQCLQDDSAVHSGGIVRVEFSPDGSRLLTGSTDRTARCLWLPVSKYGGSGTTLVGHDGPVNSVCWSHDGQLVLTTASDRTARIWGSSTPSPLITISGLFQAAIGNSSDSRAPGRLKNSSSANSRQKAPSHAAGSGGSSCVQDFVHEVTAASFYYMDELVLLASGNKLHVLRYKLADAPVDDDIQRLKSTSSYSLAGTHSSNCQAVLDVAAANSFMSTLLLLACSNRSIELVDAATLKVACSIPDAHTRPVQRLIQPAASPFVSHARGVYELFASVAPDGVVKLWDIRSGTCVRSFTGHKHSSSQVPIGAAFSPCMQYLATGSEDKAACIYDLRSSTLLHKLRPPGQADVVADVAFHPYKPRLVVGCMNGRLHWYRDVCSRAQQQGLPSGGLVDRQLVENYA